MAHSFKMLIFFNRILNYMLGSVEKDKSKEYVGFKELLHTKIGFPSEEAEVKQPLSSQGIWPHSKQTKSC